MTTDDRLIELALEHAREQRESQAREQRLRDARRLLADTLAANIAALRLLEQFDIKIEREHSHRLARRRDYDRKIESLLS